MNIPDDRLADALAGSEPVVVVEREVDASVKPRDGGFGGGVVVEHVCRWSLWSCVGCCRFVVAASLAAASPAAAGTGE